MDNDFSVLARLKDTIGIYICWDPEKHPMKIEDKQQLVELLKTTELHIKWLEEKVKILQQEAEIPEIMDVETFAKIANISKQTAYKIIHSHEIDTSVNGRHTRISREQYIKWKNTFKKWAK
jgi:excisionase family DNA binding protein